MLVLFHTAQSNVDVFDEAARSCASDNQITHVVREDLLARAQAAGRFADDIVVDALSEMKSALADGDGLLCTCSTIGPAADLLADEGRQVRRVDRALATAAFAEGGKVAAIIAAPTTADTTQQVFNDALDRAGSGSFQLHLVEGAWPYFVQGNLAQYYSAIADAAAALQPQFDVIALAQSSMAPVAHQRQWSSKILTSPQCALAAWNSGLLFAQA